MKKIIQFLMIKKILIMNTNRPKLKKSFNNNKIFN
jgi:hypothetical protein